MAIRPIPNLRGKTQVKEFDCVPDAGTAAAVGFRRKVDHAGRRPELGLRAQARRHLSGWRSHQWRARHVRSHDAGWRYAARHQPARDHPGRFRAHGSASSRNISCTRTVGRSAFRRPDIRRRKVPIIPASATATSVRSPVRSSRSISTSVSSPASTTKASTPKWPRASGNSRFSARAPKRLPMKCGWLATCCCG